MRKYNGATIYLSRRSFNVGGTISMALTRPFLPVSEIMRLLAEIVIIGGLTNPPISTFNWGCAPTSQNHIMMRWTLHTLTKSDRAKIIAALPHFVSLNAHK